LQRDRPVVWLEISLVTQETLRAVPDLQAMFPYPIVVHRVLEAGGVIRTSKLQRVTDALPIADCFVVPVEDTTAA
jgi:hypothetical protein